MAYLATPFFVYKLGLREVPGAAGLIGAIIGGSSMELFELFIALLDEIQSNPKFIIQIIKSKLGIKDEKEVQRKERKRNQDDSEGAEN
jgi:hypothetical protein